MLWSGLSKKTERTGCLRQTKNSTRLPTIAGWGIGGSEKRVAAESEAGGSKNAREECHERKRKRALVQVTDNG